MRKRINRRQDPSPAEALITSPRHADYKEKCPVKIRVLHAAMAAYKHWYKEQLSKSCRSDTEGTDVKDVRDWIDPNREEINCSYDQFIIHVVYCFAKEHGVPIVAVMEAFKVHQVKDRLVPGSAFPKADYDKGDIQREMMIRQMAVEYADEGGRDEPSADDIAKARDFFANGITV